MAVVGPNHATTFYPHQWVMPDGRMLQITTQPTSGSTQPRARGRLSAPCRSASELRRAHGCRSTEWVEPGHGRGGLASGGSTGLRAVQKYNYSTNAWTRTVDMPTARAHMNVVQIPDGTAIGTAAIAADYPTHRNMRRLVQSGDGSMGQLALTDAAARLSLDGVADPAGRPHRVGRRQQDGWRAYLAHRLLSSPISCSRVSPTTTTSPTQVDDGSQFSIGTSAHGPSGARALPSGDVRCLRGHERPPSSWQSHPRAAVASPPRHQPLRWPRQVTTCCSPSRQPGSRRWQSGSISALKRGRRSWSSGSESPGEPVDDPRAGSGWPSSSGP